MLKSELCHLSASCMATTASDFRQLPGERDAKDSRQPILIPRCPLPDAAVETDMRRTLPPASNVGSTHLSSVPKYGYSGSEGQTALRGGNPAPPMQWSHDIKSWSRDLSHHQPQLNRHLSSTCSSGSSSLGGVSSSYGREGGDRPGGERVTSGMGTTWQCSAEHVQNTHKLLEEAQFEQLTPQPEYKLVSLHDLGREMGPRYRNQGIACGEPGGGGGAAVGRGRGRGGVSGGGYDRPFGDVSHSSLYSSAAMSHSTSHQGYSSPDQLGSNHLMPLDQHIPSNCPPWYPQFNQQPPSQHHSYLHTLPSSPYMPGSQQQPLHQQHWHQAQPQPSVSPQLPGLNCFRRLPSDDCGVPQALQHNIYGSGRGEGRASYCHQPCPLPHPSTLSSSSSSGYPSLASSECVHSEDAHRHQEAGDFLVQPYHHRQLAQFSDQEQRSSPEAYSGQQHLSRCMVQANTGLELSSYNSQPQGVTRSFSQEKPCPLEGEPYSQRQQSLTEATPYLQRRPLEGDQHLQGQPPSLSLQDRRQYHLVPFHEPRKAISSFLEPPIHQQGNSLDQLMVDDYLAGETKRALSLHESGKDEREITSGADSPSYSNFIEITEHPRDVCAKTHQRVVFTCKALLLSDCAKKALLVDVLPQLQWYRGEDPLVKEVMTDLVLSDVGQEDAGCYYCVVTHPRYPSISLHSDRAHLTVSSKLAGLDEECGTEEHEAVTKAPVITSHPPPKITAVLGEELRLALEVKGEEPIKWYKDSQQLGYCQDKVLYFPSASHSEAGQYNCSVSNIHGSVLSNSFLVQVLRKTVKPRILVHPLSQHVFHGQEVELGVKVEKSLQPCRFQWFKNRTPLEGRTGLQLVIGSAVGHDSGEYFCMVVNSGGSVDSNVAFVTVKNHRAPLSSDSYYMGGSVGVSHGEAGRNWGAHHSQNQRQQHQQPLRMHGYSVAGSGNRTGLYLNTSAAGDEGHLGRVHLPRELGYCDVYDSMKEDDQPGGQGEGVKGSGDPGEGVDGEGPSRSEGQEIYRTETARATVPVSMGGRPTILEHPQSQDVEVGGPLSLSCQAVGPEDIAYLWYFNGLSLTTEIRPEYFINCFTDEDEGVYFCRVSNCLGEVDSDMAHVKMKDDD